MSLADLGGGVLTRQAVHLIETGKARPTQRSLALIAARLNRPLESFLVSVETRIAEFERHCQAHQYVEVLDLTQAVLTAVCPPKLTAMAHFYAGQALHHLCRSEEALEHLRRARALLESLDDPLLAAECLDWEATTRHRMGDVGALDAAQEALRRYRELEPRRAETEARMLEHIGTFLSRRSAHDRAEERYEEALRVVGTVRDLEGMGRIYHGLAGCRRAAGDLRGAADLMQKAVALYSVEHQLRPAAARTSLPKAENDLGILLLDQGHLQRAEELFLSALDHVTQARADHLKSWVLLSLGELRHRQGRIEEGLRLAMQGMDLAKSLDDVVARTEAHRLIAELRSMRGERALAESNLQLAMAILDRAGLAERRAELEGRYDELLGERTAGQPDGRTAGTAGASG